MGFNLIENMTRRTYRYIEGVVAFCMVLGGMYLASPFYQVSIDATGGDSLSRGLAHPAVIIAFGLLYALPGVLIFVGLFVRNKSFRSVGLFWAWLAILFTVILIWATTGLRPMTWLAPLGLGVISAIVWLRVRWEV